MSTGPHSFPPLSAARPLAISPKPGIAVAVAIGAAALGVWLVMRLPWVAIFGQNIPQDNVLQDYLVGALWAACLGVSIFFWPVPYADRKALLVLWSARTVVTLGFMLWYESFYWFLDAYEYFDNAQRVLPAQGLTLGAGTENIVSLCRLQNQVLPVSYHALKVSSAMVGLLAVYLSYRAAVIFLGRENPRLLYVLGLFPSVLFWSSILGKDPMALMGIALYIYGVVGLYRLKRPRYLLPLVLGVLVAAYVRLWLGPILLLPLASLILHSGPGKTRRVVLLGVVSTVLVLLVSNFQQQLGIEQAEDLFSTTEDISKRWATGGSAQELEMDLTNLPQLLLFIPWGAFTALLRPLPGEVGNAFGWLAGLENALLFVLLGRAVKRTRWREILDPLILWAIFLVILWAGVYSVVSYQNLGSAVRFKLQVLPLLLGILLFLGRPRIFEGKPRGQVALASPAR